jgi:tetratricopeptide (TPR) repeat protein
LAAEKFSEYQEWANLYHDWLGIYGYGKKFSGLQEKLLIEIRIAIKKKENLNEYLILSCQAERMFTLAGVDPSPAILDQMLQLLQHPLLALPDAALSVKAHHARMSILVKLYQRTGQKNKARALIKEHLDKVARNYDGTNPPPYNYLVDLHRLLNMLRKKDAGEMWQTIKKYEEVMNLYKNTISSNALLNVEIALLIHTSRYYLDKREPLKVMELTAKLKDKLKLAPPSSVPHHEMVLLSFEVFALMELRQFDKALELANRILNENYKVRNDLTSSAEWIRIIIHIEARNFNLVKTLINQAIRHSTKFKVKLGYEKELYRHLGKISEKFRAGKAETIHSAATEFLQFLESSVPDDLDFIKNWLSDIAKLKTSSGH